MSRLLLSIGLALSAAFAAQPDQRQPVLVELFTSEGCSSCPPADALLERLDRTQPVAGAQIVVLSEHVDYWNHIGWTDPYSSSQYSARQEQYARRFRIEGPYTPQMVVDGRTELLGSDPRAAESAIRLAVKQPRATIRLAKSEGNAHFQVEPLPHGTTRKASVFAAYAAESGEQDVLRGENKGRRLHHVAIVKELKQIGTVDERAGFEGKLPLKPGTRVVVFVQESGPGPVWAVAMLPAAP